MKKRLLLVDDNDKYARILTEYFGNMGFTIDRAITAAQGLEKVRTGGIETYNTIVTDITMESQLAGIFMLMKIRKLGFTGVVVVASTGFDFPSVISLSRLLLKAVGVHYLVRKTTVLKNAPEFWPITFFSDPLKQFPQMRVAG